MITSRQPGAPFRRVQQRHDQGHTAKEDEGVMKAAEQFLCVQTGGAKKKVLDVNPIFWFGGP
jgi:hypothetical protein